MNFLGTLSDWIGFEKGILNEMDWIELFSLDLIGFHIICLEILLNCSL